MHVTLDTIPFGMKKKGSFPRTNVHFSIGKKENVLQHRFCLCLVMLSPNFYQKTKTDSKMWKNNKFSMKIAVFLLIWQEKKLFYFTFAFPLPLRVTWKRIEYYINCNMICLHSTHLQYNGVARICRFSFVEIYTCSFRI